MTNLEIKERIDANNKIISEQFDPEFFTLNVAVKDLLEENSKLQRLCKHEFVDGGCRYCYLVEETP